MTNEPIYNAADVFTSDPSSWVMESYGDPVDEQGSEPDTAPLQVANTAAFFNTIIRAGFNLTLSRFPGTDTVSYVNATSAGYVLTFRRPNRGEIKRAFSGPEPVRVGYPVRVLPDPDSLAQLYGPNGFQGSTGVVMRRGSDGWASEGNASADTWQVRLDSIPDGASKRLPADRTIRFPGRFLEVIGEVSQNNADPYPCANCHGRGRSQLALLDPCIRCGGTGADPYVNKGLSDRASRGLVEPEPHEHHFPLPPNAESDPSMEPADCACGMTFAEHNAEMNERAAGEPESDAELSPSALDTITGTESARFDVVIYFNDGREPESHDDVSAARARELESTFGVSPAIERIDVNQRPDVRDDDSLWLVIGYDPSPCGLGCPHTVSQHRRDVGCAFCDCTYGRPAS
jgi:hypothetical protein